MTGSDRECTGCSAGEEGPGKCAGSRVQWLSPGSAWSLGSEMAMAHELLAGNRGELALLRPTAKSAPSWKPCGIIKLAADLLRLERAVGSFCRGLHALQRAQGRIGSDGRSGQGAWPSLQAGTSPRSASACRSPVRGRRRRAEQGLSVAPLCEEDPRPERRGRTLQAPVPWCAQLVPGGKPLLVRSQGGAMRTALPRSIPPSWPRSWPRLEKCSRTCPVLISSGQG